MRRRLGRGPWVAAVLALLLGVTPSALGQSTGGSFRSDDSDVSDDSWSTGTSRDDTAAPTSSASAAEDDDDDWSSSDDDTGSDVEVGFGELLYGIGTLIATLVGMLLALLFAALIVAQIQELVARFRTWMGWTPRAPPGPYVAVRTSIACDWDARSQLQRSLASLAQRGSKTDENVRRITEQLRSHELDWMAVFHEAKADLQRTAAREWVTEQALELRARFRDELVRSDELGTRTAPAPAMRARPEEGPGVIIVSVLLAAREAPSAVCPTDRATLARWLEECGENRSRVELLEVIWSPAAPEDRMSTAELEALYPELVPLPGAGAFGRVYCTMCGAPFTGELDACPHCGWHETAGAEAR